jgi:hypothetical protein
MKAMKKFILLVVVLVLCGGVLAISSEKSSTDSKLRVGVYKSWVVALAYARSKTGLERINSVCQKAKKAEADGDKETYEKLSFEIKELRKLGHLQVFGDEPIDEYIEEITPALKEIAKEQNLDLITAKIFYDSEKIEQVDITDLLVKQFEPDETTMKMIEGMKNYKPLKRDKLLEAIRKDEI